MTQRQNNACNDNARPRGSATPFHTMNGLLAALGLVVFGYEIESGKPARHEMPQLADAADLASGPDPENDNSEAMPDHLAIRIAGAEMRLRGHIAPGDAGRVALEIAARRRAGDPVARVTLDSTGGSLHDALLIGRVLRSAGVTTEVRDNDICFSACPYLFAGGAQRIAQGNARLGVHQATDAESDQERQSPRAMLSDLQSSEARVISYLDEMGVGLGMLQPALATPPDRIHVLSAQELSRYHLTTAPIRG
ncbi:hypothetical protein [Thioclava pacifica]|uniref:Uncharacterized protein n=1 Tax=Thioclava pacifica DSM 10166 TaxID=1353537 RepID=A0A074J8U9_9RHOB|nr:hypothetical protein [Thioclava pacifica]KEO53981.1 hypothetical protein TP2_03460 [Thioclava pacifica DSM 10166]